jgi:hypothetical protein
MTVGPGVKGLPAENFTAVKGEYEIILPPNQKMMVTAIEKKNEGYEIHHIHAIVLPTEKNQCC